MNYPKMLYKGNQKEYQHIIAENATQEELLIDEGWKGFADIPELDESQTVGTGNASAGERAAESFITQELFDLATQELVDVKQNLVIANTEIERLNQVIAAGSAENAGLREQLAALQSASTGSAAGDLSALTTEQLREMITAQGKTFKQRDSKPELIAILES